MTTARILAPFVATSPTSIEAAESIAPNLEPLEAKVAAYVRSQGRDGATCDQAEIATGLKHQTCSARFNALRDRGVLVQTERTRLTSSGRKAAVYVHRHHAS